MNLGKIVLLLLVLNIQHDDDDQQFDHRHIAVHLNGHALYYHTSYQVFVEENLICTKMKNISDVLGRHIDPGAPLSNVDLAKLLMNDSTTKVRNLEESIKENEKLDREHNKIVIENVVTRLCKHINALEEFTLNGKNDLTKTLSDLDLKVTTVCAYQEHLIYKLHDKVHDLSVQLQSHKKSCQENIRCELCELFFTSMSDYINHMFQHHTTSCSFPCTFCGKVWKTEHSWRSHMRECTSGIQLLQPSSVMPSQSISQYALENCHESLSEGSERNPCGENLPGVHDLQLHGVEAHDQSYQHVYQCDHAASLAQAMYYSCNFCRVTFESQYYLQLHIRDVHNVTVTPFNASLGFASHESTFHPSAIIPCPDTMNEEVDYHGPHTGTETCTVCGYTCYSEELLRHHLPSHERSNTVHCNKCERSFNSIVLLNTHVAMSHTESENGTSLPLGPDANIPHSNDNQDEHTDNEDDLILGHEVNIPQYDGMDEISDSDPETVESEATFIPSKYSVVNSCGFRGNNEIGVGKTMIHKTTYAPYALNKRKQIATLAKHSNLCDFNIEVTSAHNTNIQCSAGFYEAVPKPALTAISEGFRATVSGVLVNCIESRVKQDQLGRHDNLVLRFLVAIDGANTAVVHLHHTQQLVQVQGSASQWLVKNFLRHVFLEKADSKRQLINDLNKVFDATGRNLEKQINNESEDCTQCGVKFRKNSKPAVCGNCSGSFHNTKQSKCFMLHNCRTPTVPSTLLSPTSSVSSALAAPRKSTDKATPVPSSTVPLLYTTCNPASISTTTSTTSSITTTACSTSSSIFSRPSSSASTITTVSPYSLNPGAESYQPNMKRKRLSPSLNQADKDQGQELVQVTVSHVHPPQGAEPEHHQPATQFRHGPSHAQLLGDQEDLEAVVSVSTDTEQHRIRNLPNSQPHTEPHLPPMASSSIKFPSTAIRQRNTNVNLSNPENEFLRTALNSCKSNIIQQEAEIKRLKETLSIRNRRIMQLEDEIKYAGDHVASRDSGNTVADQNHKCCHAILENFSSKISGQTCGSSTTNVYVNSSKESIQTSHNKYSQTDTNLKPCNCSSTSQSSKHGSENHLETVHEHAYNELLGDHCGENLNIRDRPHNHGAGRHRMHPNTSQSLVCDICGKTYISDNDLRLHIEADHGTGDVSVDEGTPDTNLPVSSPPVITL